MRQNFLHKFFLIIFTLTASQTLIADEDQPDFHVAFSGFYAQGNTDDYQDEYSYNVQLTSTFSLFEIGVEGSTQLDTAHDYTYTVPYGEHLEKRRLDIITGSLILNMLPWKNAYIATSFGGFLSGSYVLDRAPQSSFHDNIVTRDKALSVGPSVRLELFPRNLFSLFVEARRSYQIFGHIQRPAVVSTDVFGNTIRRVDNLKLDFTYLGLGFRVNFER
jgi:hypothetical protein